MPPSELSYAENSAFPKKTPEQNSYIHARVCMYTHIHTHTLTLITQWGKLLFHFLSVKLPRRNTIFTERNK
jgi:hypothetical protein